MDVTEVDFKPITAFIKKRNFSAKLPDDFVLLKSITRPDGNKLPNDSFMQYAKIDCFGRFITEQFCIKEDRILFSGNFSRYFIIRLFQKFWEWLFPQEYKIEYFKHK